MADEIELKIAIGEPQGLRAALSELAARYCGRVLEFNHILDDARRSLKRASSALRVRETRPLDSDAAARCTLTWKGPRKPGPLKVREEIETVVTDARVMLQLLRHLGFDCLLRYQKRRETYALPPCEVVLDELPLLGWFAEIEGPSVAEVSATAARLGLDKLDPVTDSYVDLTAALGAQAADGALELRFTQI